VTAPNGGAITGCIVKFNGNWMHVVMNSAGGVYCSTDGANWAQCQDQAGKYNAGFIKTDKYTSGLSIAAAAAPVFASVVAAPGWWYQGTVNRITVGLTKQAAGNDFVTAPNGGAITGCVVVLNGAPMHVVMNSVRGYYCSTDGASWYQCQQYAGEFDAGFVKTRNYPNGVAIAAPVYQFAPVSAAVGWWYQGLVNGRQVGLTKQKGGNDYVTAPNGGAITGCIVMNNGV